MTQYKNYVSCDVNGLLMDEIFHNCFVCGDEKYCEFYEQGHLYRVCPSCLKTDKVKNFFERWAR